jgi:hypothetical protein
MADGVFNIALGRVRELSSLGATNDALVLILLKTSGLEADGTLRDYDDVAAILAAANDEADFTGYARRTLASVTNTAPDDTNNRADTDAADPASYTNSGGASQAVSKAIIAYDPDTTGGTDSSLVPLTFHDCVVTFDVGVATTISFNASGFYRAQG